MADHCPLPPFSAIVVAAGQGMRAGGNVPKQFRMWRGKPLVRHSVEALLAAGADEVVVVIPDGGRELAELSLTGLDKIKLTIGGNTRQQSVLKGLRAITPSNAANVLIHDAARPDLPQPVIARLLFALEGDPGAIPVLPVIDSLAVADGPRMGGKADRDALRRVQTPQAFRYEAILAAHEAWDGVSDAGDDAQVLTSHGETVALVEGDERLKKITFAEDFVAQQSSIRVGTGFDVHRLVTGEELWLAGIKVPHTKGLAGHSDADVVLHALVDALLGAIGDGDIGTHFPPSDPQWKGASSDRFVTHAVGLISRAGYAIANIDLTIICEEPKIGPHRDAMRNRLAELTGLELSQVSLKATTTERLGFTGRGEGIAAQAMISLQQI